MTPEPVPPIATERREGVYLIGLERPDRRNAIDQAMVDAFHAALDEASRVPAVLIIHSKVPGIFASGADLREVLDRDADAALSRINVDLFDRLARFRWPTIAAIAGPAIGGGCELALACDFRVISPTARFGQPETSLGLLAGAGGNWRLAQLVGLGIARRMLLAGVTVAGEEAVAAGLADSVAPDPFEAALAMAGTIASRSWRALELTKAALSIANCPSTTFDTAAQALLFDGADKRKRVEAFLERSQPSPQKSGARRA